MRFRIGDEKENLFSSEGKASCGDIIIYDDVYYTVSLIAKEYKKSGYSNEVRCEKVAILQKL